MKSAGIAAIVVAVVVILACILRQDDGEPEPLDPPSTDREEQGSLDSVRRFVALGPSKAEPVTSQQSSAATASGSVLDSDLACVRVHVREATTSAPIAGEVVVLDLDDSRLDDRDILQARTGSDGIVEFRGVAPGEIRISTSRGANRNLTVRKREVLSVEFEIDLSSQLEVRVLNDLGEGIPKATILVTTGQHSGECLALGETGESGSFVLEGVFGRRYVAARRGGYEPSDLIPLPETSPGARKSVDVILRTGGFRLAGRISDTSGKPIQDCEVRLGRRTLVSYGTPDGGKGIRSGSVSTRSAEDGSFLFETVTRGEHPIVVRHRNYATHCEAVFINPLADNKVSVVLLPGSTILGRVLLSSNEPAGNASVWFGSSDGERRNALTDERGFFSFEKVTSGRIDMRAEKIGCGQGVVTVAVPPEPSTLECVVTLERGKVISGRVHGRDLPQGLVTACLSGTERDGQRTGTVDQNGEFFIENCEVATYDIRIYERNDYAVPVAVKSSVVAPSDGVVIDVFADRGNTVMGGVLSADVLGVKEVRLRRTGTIEILRERGNVQRNGRFTIGTLSDGSYELVVSVGGRERVLATVSMRKGERVDLGWLRAE